MDIKNPPVNRVGISALTWLSVTNIGILRVIAKF